MPGPRFGIDGTLERFLRLPFVLPSATLREAVSRLAQAAEDVPRFEELPGEISYVVERATRAPSCRLPCPWGLRPWPPGLSVAGKIVTGV